MSIRKLSNELRLLPVIELSPGDLGGFDLPAPGGGQADEGLEAHWKRCLEKAGIEDARPIAPDTWLLPTDDIVSPRAMRHLLKAHLGPATYVGNVDAAPSMSALQGGFALLDGEEVVLVPGCCGDLHSLKEWERAAAHRKADKAVVRVGHPALSVRWDGGELWLREEPEDGFPADPATLRVSADALAAAAARARKEVDAFSNRLSSVLREMRRKPERMAMASAASAASAARASEGR